MPGGYGRSIGTDDPPEPWSLAESYGRLYSVGVMSEDQRTEFLNRISSVGWGSRENVQMLLGGIVTTIRAQVAESGFGEDEMGRVVAFHDATEEFWRATMSTKPPMPSPQLIEGIRKLGELCVGPLAGFQVQVERALDQAELFDQLKRHRDLMSDELGEQE